MDFAFVIASSEVLSLLCECVEGMEGELDGYVTEIARPPDRRARARSQGLELDMSP